MRFIFFVLACLACATSEVQRPNLRAAAGDPQATSALSDFSMLERHAGVSIQMLDDLPTIKDAHGQPTGNAILNPSRALFTILWAHHPAIAFSSSNTGMSCAAATPSCFCVLKAVARSIPMVHMEDLISLPVKVAPPFEPQDISEYPIYYINLASRIDRRTRLEHQLLNHGLSATRFEACTGEDVDDSIIDRIWSPKLNSQFDKRQNPDSWHIVCDGERGCAGSHVALWEKCVADNRPIVILEDDVIFSEEFLPRYKKAVEWIAKRDPTFMYFQVNPGEWGDFQEAIDSSMIVKDVKYSWQTSGYVIWPQTACTLLSHLPMHEPLDNFLSRMAWHDIIRIYTCFPFLMMQYSATDGDIPHTGVDEWSEVQK